MFRHVVFFRFHDPKDASEARRRLMSMDGEVSSLRRIEVGLDCLHTERSWDMILDTRFDDREGYEAYRSDPLHLEVLGWLAGAVRQSATVDVLDADE